MFLNKSLKKRILKNIYDQELPQSFLEHFGYKVVLIVKVLITNIRSF